LGVSVAWKLECLLMTLLMSYVPWLIALIAVLLMMGMFQSKRARRRALIPMPPLPDEWRLSARPLFRVRERLAYQRLREALPDHVILAKLQLVRFCQPDDPGEVRFWHDLIGSIAVTFCICSGSGRVLAVIDLEGSRDESTRTRQIKHSVLDACRIRYLRCTEEDMPSVAELRGLVPPVDVKFGSRAAELPPGNPQHTAAAAPPPASWGESGALADSFFGDEASDDDLSGSEYAALHSQDSQPSIYNSTSGGRTSGHGLDSRPSTPRH
jgi:Protein of unknown function (DUF2726)